MSSKRQKEPCIFWNYEVTAQRLHDLRIKSGYTFENLKDKLSDEYNYSISVDSLKNYEVTDKYHSRYGTIKGMTLETLLAFSSLYKVSCDYLLNLTDEPSPSYDRQILSKKMKLSPEALDTLDRQKSESRTEVLTDVVSSPEFNRIIAYLSDAVERSRETKISKELQEVTGMKKELDQMSTKLFVANGHGYHEHFAVSKAEAIALQLYRARIQFDNMIQNIIKRRSDNGKYEVN